MPARLPVRRRFRRRVVRRTRPMRFRRPRPSVAALSVRRSYNYFEVGAAGPVYAGYSYNLSSIPGYINFTNLFDQYRINLIVLKFWLRIELPDATTDVIPKLFYAKDYNDVNTPTSIAEVRQYSNHKCVKLSTYRPVVVKLRPATLSLIYNGLTSAYSSNWRKWLQTTAASVPHYGLKCAIDLLPVGQAVDVEATYYMSFKNAK